MIIEELKDRRLGVQGLWESFLPESEYGAGLTNLEYAPLCEIMGRSSLRPEAFQLLGSRHGQHGSARPLRYLAEQKAQWLVPLLEGKIRSCFAMTEPDVASVRKLFAVRARRRFVRFERPQVVVLGAGDPRCRFRRILWVSTAVPLHHIQQSMILVPMDAPGVTIKRTLSVFGYDDAPMGMLKCGSRM